MKYTFTNEDRANARRTKDIENMPEVFRNGSNHANSYLKRLLIEYKNLKEECSACGITEWNNKKLKLQLDHVDGNTYNNEVSNLRFLCPNCHSQTDTYAGGGNTGQIKVSDEELIIAIKSSKNIRSALIKTKLSPKGGNYRRVRELVDKYNLKFNANVEE